MRAKKQSAALGLLGGCGKALCHRISFRSSPDKRGRLPIGRRRQLSGAPVAWGDHQPALAWNCPSIAFYNLLHKLSFPSELKDLGDSSKLLCSRELKRPKGYLNP